MRMEDTTTTTPSKSKPRPPSQRGGSSSFRTSLRGSLRLLLVTVIVVTMSGRQVYLSSSVVNIRTRNNNKQAVVRTNPPPVPTAHSAAMVSSSSQTIHGTDIFVGAPTTTTTNNSIGNDSSIYTTNNSTLALLYPPGLLGGYRNQVLRFLALCVRARTMQADLWLHSIWWTSSPGSMGRPHSDSFPVFMGDVFDVPHWNDIAALSPLPRLATDTLDNGNSDCWMSAKQVEEELLVSLTTTRNNNSSKTALRNNHTLAQHYKYNNILSHGLLAPLANQTLSILTGQTPLHNPRKIDWYHQVRHCRSPQVYGGGRGAGRLWNDYLGYQKSNKNGGSSSSNNSSSSHFPYAMDAWLYQALRPAPQWRALAQSCIAGSYVALHARIELEMMTHACGRSMEKNLTRILEWVRPLSQKPLFVAVSRAGVFDTTQPAYSQYQAVADENMATLNALTGSGDIVECGETLLEEYYRHHYNVPNLGSLLTSVVNFYLAVEAETFVGVADSSYSTDVLTTRYFLGKQHNYRYTTRGLEQVVGRPKPHGNCKRKRPR